MQAYILKLTQNRHPEDDTFRRAEKTCNSRPEDICSIFILDVFFSHDENNMGHNITVTVHGDPGTRRRGF